MANAKNVQHGTAGATPINVDLSRIDHGSTRKVQLTSNYTLLCGAGIPTRPGMTGASQANLEYPRTLSSGTQITLSAEEAAALVTAGKATYV